MPRSRCATKNTWQSNPARYATGSAWSAEMINPDNGRIAARRVDDNVLGAFPTDYVREHITHGYAVTVHSAQGVTAGTTHAVLGENASRALLYVAMTSGRHANTAWIYQAVAAATNPTAQNPSACATRTGTAEGPQT